MSEPVRSLDRLTIPTPCQADWDSMIGTDQVRFCEHCNLHVTDLSAMTRPAAMRLVERSRGKLCVRFIQRPGGGVLSRTVPEKLYRISRRVSRIAAGAFTATLSLSSAAAQASLRPGTDVSRQVSTIAKVISPEEQATSLSGIITDPHGAVVPGANVTLTNRAKHLAFNFVTGEDGTYRFSLLEAGVYSLSVEALSFAKTESSELNLGPHTNETLDLAVDLPVLVEEVEVRMQVEIQGRVSIRRPEDPLVRAAFNDDLDAVEQLVLTSSEINVSDKITDQTALFYAVENGNREMVRILLAAGADIDARNRVGQTALMHLNDKSNVSIVRDLIAAGADVNARDQRGETPLLEAANSSSLAVIQELITHGARAVAKNDLGTTALIRAAENSNAQITVLLLKFGVDVNAQDENNETALLNAARWGSAATVKVLLDARADVNATDDEEKTALILAANNESPRILKLLIDAGADVNATDENESTALMSAVEEGKVQIVKVLIEAGAIVDARDDEGRTALMRASEPETTLLLLNAGADFTLKDDEGQTALSLARKNEHHQVVKLLKSRGAPE